jgi:hypothetical protein
MLLVDCKQFLNNGKDYEKLTYMGQPDFSCDPSGRRRGSSFRPCCSWKLANHGPVNVGVLFAIRPWLVYRDAKTSLTAVSVGNGKIIISD